MQTMPTKNPFPYYRVRNGRAFWEPGKFGEQYGFQKCVKLGEDGADAKSAALKWNEKLDLGRADLPPTRPLRHWAPETEKPARGGPSS